MTKILYRPIATLNDCIQLTSLHRRIFPASTIERTIFAGSSIEKYLFNLICFPAPTLKHLFFGAWCDEQLIGYIHARALTYSWHLNYIGVAHEFKSQGIGQKLWEWYIHFGIKHGYHQISLDVDETNLQAFNWYVKKGLKKISTNYGYELPIQTDSLDLQDFALLDWETAEAWQNYYGFSQFRLMWNKQEWAVGRLGDQYFNISSVVPNEVRRALAFIDSSRSVWLTVATPIFPVPHLITYRMEGLLQ